MTSVAALGYIVLVLLGGATLPIQAGVNATRRLAGQSAPRLVRLLRRRRRRLAARRARGRTRNSDRGRPGPWWAWTGGVLGAFYVVGAVVSAPRLGAAAFIAVLFAGQTVASLLADQFGWVDYEQRDITPGRIVGVALLSVGVQLVRVL
jgi:transporter family-2 protein